MDVLFCDTIKLVDCDWLKKSLINNSYVYRVPRASGDKPLCCLHGTRNPGVPRASGDKPLCCLHGSRNPGVPRASGDKPQNWFISA